MIQRYLAGGLLVLLVICQTGAVAATPPVPGIPRTFQDRFLFGMVSLASGRAIWISGGAGSPGAAVTVNALLPKGSVIATPADGTAELRLGSGSLIRLAPSTRVRILRLSLELQQGAVLARHTAAVLPLRIVGASTLVLEEGTLLEVERQGQRFMARVQVGRVQTPGLKNPVAAGSCFQATGGTASLGGNGPSPRCWWSSTLPSAPGPLTTPGKDVFEGDEFAVPAGAQGTPSIPPSEPKRQNPPATRPAPPDTPPDTGEVVPATEDMLVPEPVQE